MVRTPIEVLVALIGLSTESIPSKSIHVWSPKLMKSSNIVGIYHSDEAECIEVWVVWVVSKKICEN